MGYCRYCLHYKEKSKIVVIKGEEYIQVSDHCKKYPKKKINEYDERECYEESSK